VLDAQNKGRVFYVKGADIVIQGVHLTGGDAKDQGGTSWGDDVGGGLYADNASFDLRDCEIDHNTADGGSGVYLENGSHIQLQNCHIHHNQGLGAALVLYHSRSVTLIGNTITHNVGGNHFWRAGIGIANAVEVTVQGNTIAFNQTSFYGGGLSISGGEVIVLTGNLIQENEAPDGGGIFLYFSNVHLVQNRIIGNKASWEGGGVDIEGEAPRFENTVLTDNHGVHGSGVCINRASPHFVHTTLARNEGETGIAVQTVEYGGDHTPSHVVMTNTIVFSHTVGISIDKDSTVRAETTLWQNNGKDWDGAGTIDHSHDYTGDPRFAFDGYHLLLGSAAIDKGVNAGASNDIDGDHRPYGTGYDIGADEYLGTAIQVKKLFLP